ncbi:hypothetical protein BCV72DRAFT_215059, partial [Rhizopus microsporus var. microsporus]
KILIDLLPVNSTVKTFIRENLLNDHKFMEDFQCRKAPVQGPYVVSLINK